MPLSVAAGVSTRNKTVIKVLSTRVDLRGKASDLSQNQTSKSRNGAVCVEMSASSEGPSTYECKWLLSAESDNKENRK